MRRKVLWLTTFPTHPNEKLTQSRKEEMTYYSFKTITQTAQPWLIKVVLYKGYTNTRVWCLLPLLNQQSVGSEEATPLCQSTAMKPQLALTPVDSHQPSCWDSKTN